MRHLGVIRVRFIKRVCFANRYVYGLGFAAVLHAGVVGLAAVTHKLFKERVWTRGVVRRVRHRQDGLIRTLRKSFDLAERRIFQLFGQPIQEMLAPGLFAREGLTETFHRAGIFLCCAAE